MKRDTKRIEQILENTRENRRLVREEISAGASLQHVYDDLGSHEQQFTQRLKDLNDWNKKQDDSSAPSPAIPVKPSKSK